MGFRVEEAMESTVCNSSKDEIMEIPHKTIPRRARVVEGSSDREDERDGDIMEFVMLLEVSESSETLKGLLLKILESNKTEELKPFLKDRSIERQRRPKKQNIRRSSITRRSDAAELNNGSSHKTSSTSRTSKIIGSGSGHKATSTFTKLNGLPSPGSSLRRARQSEGCLRMARHAMQSSNQIQSPSQKSRVVSSSSLLQLRNSRRADIGRRRSMFNASTSQGDLQVEKQNASWEPRSAPPTGMKKRGVSMGSFLRPAPFDSPDSDSKNASWGSAISPRRVVQGMDKLRQNTLLRKTSDRKLGISPKKRNVSDHSKNGEKKATKTGLRTKKRNGSDHFKKGENKSRPEMNNSFAQFSPTGHVSYRENNVNLNDLVDDLKSYRDSISSFDALNVSSSSIDSASIPEKKGLGKYLKKQVAKKGKDASESDKYASLCGASLCDDNEFVAGDVSITS